MLHYFFLILIAWKGNTWLLLTKIRLFILPTECPGCLWLTIQITYLLGCCYSKKLLKSLKQNKTKRTLMPVLLSCQRVSLWEKVQDNTSGENLGTGYITQYLGSLGKSLRISESQLLICKLWINKIHISGLMRIKGDYFWKVTYHIVSTLNKS